MNESANDFILVLKKKYSLKSMLQMLFSHSTIPILINGSANDLILVLNKIFSKIFGKSVLVY